MCGAAQGSQIWPFAQWTDADAATDEKGMRTLKCGGERLRWEGDVI